VPSGESYDKLTLKTASAVHYAHWNYEFEFFFKIDDDAFVVIPRLLRLLDNYEPDHLYLGRLWSVFLSDGVFIIGFSLGIIQKHVDFIGYVFAFMSLILKQERWSGAIPWQV
jgi:hypothetical protein